MLEALVRRLLRLLTGMIDISVKASLGLIIGIVLAALAASWLFPKPEQAKH